MNLEERIQSLKNNFHSGTHVKDFTVLNERVRAIVKDLETGEETEIYGDSLEDVLREIVPLFERKIRRKRSLKVRERKELKEKVRELKAMLNDMEKRRKERLEPGPGEALEPRTTIEELEPEGEEESTLGGGEEEAVEGEELGAPSIKFTGGEKSEGPFDWFKRKARGGLGSIKGREPKHKVELSERIRLEMRIIAVYIKEYAIVTMQENRDMERSNALEREISIIFGQSFDEVVETGRARLLVGKYGNVKEGLDLWVTKMESYLLALKSGGKTSDFKEEWIGTSKRLGDEMQELNTVHWDNSIISKTLGDVINSVEKMAKARLSKSWKREIQAFDELVDEMTKFADIVSAGDMKRSTREKRGIIGMSREKAMLFRTSRRLWFDHISYTYLYMRASLKKQGRDESEIKSIAERLFKNQESLGDMIAKGYKPMEGSQVTGLLKDHIKIAAEIVQSAYTNVVVDGMEVWAWDAKEAKPLLKKWQNNADDIARKLNKLNSSCWPLGKLKILLYDHLNANKEVLAAILREGKTSEELQMFSAAALQVMKVAKIFYKGVAKKKCTPKEISSIVNSRSRVSLSHLASTPSGSCGIGPSFVTYKKDKKTRHILKTHFRPEKKAMKGLFNILKRIEENAFMRCVSSVPELDIEMDLDDAIWKAKGAGLLVYSRGDTWNIIQQYQGQLIRFVESRLEKSKGDDSFAKDEEEGQKFNGVFASYFMNDPFIKQISLEHRSKLAEGLARLADCVANKVSSWARILKETYEDLSYYTRLNIFEVVTEAIATKNIRNARDSISLAEMTETMSTEKSGSVKPSEGLVMKRRDTVPRRRFDDPPQKPGFMTHSFTTCIIYPLPFVVNLAPVVKDSIDEGEMNQLVQAFSLFNRWLTKIEELIRARLALSGFGGEQKNPETISYEASEIAKEFARAYNIVELNTKYSTMFGEEEVINTFDGIVRFVDENAVNFKEKGVRKGRWIENDALLKRFSSVMTGLCKDDKRVGYTFDRMFSRYRTYLYIMVDTNEHNEVNAQRYISEDYHIPRYMKRDYLSFRNAVFNCVHKDVKPSDWESESAPHLEEYSRSEYPSAFKLETALPSRRHRRDLYSPHPRTSAGTPLTFFDWSNSRGFWGEWTGRVIRLVDAVIVNSGVITDERDTLIEYGKQSVRKLNYMRFLTVSEERGYEVVKQYTRFVEDLANKGSDVKRVTKFSELDSVERNLIVVFGGWCMERDNQERGEFVTAFVNHASKIREYIRESASALVRLPFSFELEGASVKLVDATKRLADACVKYIRVHGRTPKGKEDEGFSSDRWGMSESSHLFSNGGMHELGSHGVVLESGCHKKKSNGHNHHHHLDKKIGAKFWKKFSKRLFKYLIIYSGAYDPDFTELADTLFEKTGVKKADELFDKLNSMIEDFVAELEKWDFMTSEKRQKFKERILRAIKQTTTTIIGGDIEGVKNEILFNWGSVFDYIKEECENVSIMLIQDISTSSSIYYRSLMNVVKFIMENREFSKEESEERKESLHNEYAKILKDLKTTAKALGKDIKRCVKNTRSFESNEKSSSKLPLPSGPNKKREGRIPRRIVVEDVGPSFWEQFTKKLIKYLVVAGTESGVIRKHIMSFVLEMDYKDKSEEREDLRSMIDKAAGKLHELDLITEEKRLTIPESVMKHVDHIIEFIRETSDRWSINDREFYTSWQRIFSTIAAFCPSDELMESLDFTVDRYADSMMVIIRHIMSYSGDRFKLGYTMGAVNARLYVNKYYKRLMIEARRIGEIIATCIRMTFERRESISNSAMKPETSAESLGDMIDRIINLEPVDENEEGPLLPRRRKGMRSTIKSIDEAFGREFWERYMILMKLYLAKVADGDMNISYPVSGALFPEEANKFLDDIEKEMIITLENSVQYAIDDKYMTEREGVTSMMGFSEFYKELARYITRESKLLSPGPIVNRESLVDSWDNAIEAIVSMCLNPRRRLEDVFSQLMHAIISFAESLPSLKRKIVNEGMDIDSIEGEIVMYNPKAYSDAIDRLSYRIGLSFEACTKNPYRESLSNIKPTADPVPKTTKPASSESNVMAPRNTKVDEENHSDVVFSFLRRPEKTEFRREKISLF